MTTAVDDVSTRSDGVKRPELIGLGALVGAGALLVAVGTRLLTGPFAVVALSLVFASILALVVVAVTGTPESRRKIAPYGLLKPGMLWLALFYLAPLFTLLRLSLSTLPSRFAVDAEFDWNFGNYAEAFTDFGPQFQRAFLYAGIATVLTIAIGYPLAYVIAFRGGKYRTLLLGLVVIPFFTSYLIRTIAWRSLLSDQGQFMSVINTLQLDWLLETLQIMDDGRLINTPAAVIFGLTYNFLPFMILPIYVSLEKIDVRLLDAAKDLYSTSTAAFAKVIVPLSILDRLSLVGVLESVGIAENGGLLSTHAAVIGGLTYNFLPFMILPIYVSLEKIDVRLLDAAKDLYSTSTAAFAKVVVPLSIPGIFAGTLLTFIPAAGDFVNSLYLGSPNTTMIGNSIQDQFLVQNNVPLASAMSFVLMFIITVFVLIYSKFFGTEDLA